jgi:hypothetical protein
MCMPVDDNPFALPPPAPREKKTTLRVILALSAVAHLTVFALASRNHEPPPAAEAPTGEMVRVLRGKVTTGDAEAGLRLSGYANVAAPSRAPSPAGARR